MKFVLGIIVGAVGLWAYQNGKLQNLMGGAPEPVQHAWTTGTERISKMADADQVRQVTSTIQDKMGQSSPIVTPSASEVSGRPSEPLPGAQA
jgi:hypothetical protein